jgi:histidyl-tRNA synthetase
LRTLGLKVETNLEEQNLKQLFKAAKKNQAKKIIVLGDEEIKTQIVKIKDQETGLEINRQFNTITREDF